MENSNHLKNQNSKLRCLQIGLYYVGFIQINIKWKIQVYKILSRLYFSKLRAQILAFHNPQRQFESMNESNNNEAEDSELNSSTSSYSELMPIEDPTSELRRDKSIVMISIPMNRKKQKPQLNQTVISQKYITSQKYISQTLINSTHANTNLQRSNFMAQADPHQLADQKMQRSHSNSQTQKQQSCISQKLIKSSHQSSFANLHGQPLHCQPLHCQPLHGQVIQSVQTYALVQKNSSGLNSDQGQKNDLSLKKIVKGNTSEQNSGLKQSLEWKQKVESRQNLPKQILQQKSKNYAKSVQFGQSQCQRQKSQQSITLNYSLSQNSSRTWNQLSSRKIIVLPQSSSQFQSMIRTTQMIQRDEQKSVAYFEQQKRSFGLEKPQFKNKKTYNELQKQKLQEQSILQQQILSQKTNSQQLQSQKSNSQQLQSGKQSFKFKQNFRSQSTTIQNIKQAYLLKDTVPEMSKQEQYAMDCQIKAIKQIRNEQVGMQQTKNQQRQQKNQVSSFKNQQRQYKVKYNQEIQKQKQFKQNQNMHLPTITSRQKVLQNRIQQLQAQIRNQSESIIIQRKANQVYTQFYHNLSKVVQRFIQKGQSLQFQFSQSFALQNLDQSVNMQKILHVIQTLTYHYQSHHPKESQMKKIMAQKNVQTQKQSIENAQKFNNYSQISFFYQTKLRDMQNLLFIQQQKTSHLRKQLLQSTQNNISAIFNTQISASCCLQNQVFKINNEMTFLKQKINLLILKNTEKNSTNYQPQIIYLPQSNLPYPAEQKQQVKKIIKIYTTKDRINEYSQNSQNSDTNSAQGSRQRKRSLNSNKKRYSKKQRPASSSSQISSKSTKKRDQTSKIELEKLKQAYNQTKNQLSSLIQVFSLITNQQTEMKGYFSQIKDEIMKAFHQKMKQKQEISKHQMETSQHQIEISRHEMEISKRQIFQRKQLLLKKEEEIRIQQQMKRKQHEAVQMLRRSKKQDSYLTELESIKKERQQDRKVMQGLNRKMVQLVEAICVPERVSQQYKNNRMSQNVYQEVPSSQISVSVQCLRQIQYLRSLNQKQKAQVQMAQRQNQFLKEQIQNLKHILFRANTVKNHNSVDTSRQAGQSIIHQLNGLTQMTIPPPFLTNRNFDESLKGSTIPRNIATSNREMETKHVTFHNKDGTKQIKSFQKVESQKNIQNNFKTVLMAKQNHIQRLEREVLNFQQTNDYLKRQILQKQKIIQDLEHYIGSLQSRSINSISLSGIGANIMPETNLYLDSNGFSQNVKAKYENYVKNLKILLKQTRNQNKILREKLQSLQLLESLQQQTDQLTESNLGLKNSISHSQRTTKNFPNSATGSPINPRNNGEIIIRKRTDFLQRGQNQRPEQIIKNPDVELISPP